jgi:uncharacterized membrane protein YhdT
MPKHFELGALLVCLMYVVLIYVVIDFGYYATFIAVVSLWRMYNNITVIW